VNGIKRQNELRVKTQSVSLDKREWVVGLRLNIHSNNIESSPTVPGSCTASTTEQVE
jgi:hypothetical protein